MVKAAVALLRKIWRQIRREIFRESATLTLPVPAHPRGQESGAVPGTFVSPPEPQRVLLDELTENILSRLPVEMDLPRTRCACHSKATRPSRRPAGQRRPPPQQPLRAPSALAGSRPEDAGGV